MKLPGIERKLRVAIDWTLDLFFQRDIVYLRPLHTARGTGLIRVGTTEQSLPDEHPKHHVEPSAAAALALPAPPPPHVSVEDALKGSGADAVYYGTQMRGASNAKAKRELNFQPRPLEWIGDTAMAQAG